MSTEELRRRNLPSVLLVLGTLLIVVALTMVINRARLTENRAVVQTSASGEPIAWTMQRNERSELTLMWCATLSAVLGVGIVLIGCARWPAR